MKILIVYTCLQFFMNAATAQDKSISVHASVLGELPDSARYRYPSFTKGYIFYKNGSSAYANFNVNQLIDEIQFIHPNGDTLSIVDEESIRLITIGKDSFFIRKGVVELMQGYSQLRLGRSQKITVMSRERVGAYGEASGTTSITSFGSFFANDQVFQLRLNENVLLQKLVTFYFIRNDFLTFLPATKNNLMKMVRDKQGINEYLQKNTIDFKKENDLKKLLDYINSGL